MDTMVVRTKYGFPATTSVCILVSSYHQSGLWYNRRLDAHIPIGGHLDLRLQPGKYKTHTD